MDASPPFEAIWPILKVRIMQRARIDEDFRLNLISDARGAIERSFAIVLPDSVRVHPISQEPHALYITVPQLEKYPNPASEAQAVGHHLVAPLRTFQGQIFDHDLFDEAECESIIANARGSHHWQNAKVKRNSEDERVNKAVRSSEVIYEKLDPHLFDGARDKIEKHIFQPLCAEHPNLELSAFQLVRYSHGDYFHFHRDNSSIPQRLLTVIIYLNDGFVGGQTVFPETQLTFAPRTGTALIFDSSLLHAAEAISEGCKFVLVGWILYKDTSSLASRLTTNRSSKCEP